LPLIPLARFPGLVWIIAIGLALPMSIERPNADHSGCRRDTNVKAIERMPGTNHETLHEAGGTSIFEDMRSWLTSAGHDCS
jgi:hypothetical protein